LSLSFSSAIVNIGTPAQFNLNSRRKANLTHASLLMFLI
jgi:hypothetical protein